VLRVDHRTGEPIHAGELRAEALVIAVVAGAYVEEGATEPRQFVGVGAVHLDGPTRVGTVPVRAAHTVIEPNQALHVELAGGVVDVTQDARSIGDRLRLRPGSKPVTEGEHVRVGANAGITEQIPGAPDGLTRLEDHHRFLGVLTAQLAGCAHAGQSRAHDEDVGVLDRLT
jgi:hypothetical protein